MTWLLWTVLGVIGAVALTSVLMALGLWALAPLLPVPDWDVTASYGAGEDEMGEDR